MIKNAVYQNLILFGYPSSGKTFWGARLARELKRIFIDTDDRVEELYKKEYGEFCTCRQIALKLGEEGFRQIEKRVIHDLKEVHSAIIALGGGAILNPENCSKLEKWGKLIYLEVDKEIIKHRLFRKGIPSFLDSHDLEGSFEKMYAMRHPLYEKINAFKINTQGKTDEQILDELENIGKFVEFKTRRYVNVFYDYLYF